MTPSLFSNLMAPYTDKAKPYHTTSFLYGTSSLSSLMLVAAKNHIQTIKIHNKYSIPPFPTKKTLHVVPYNPLNHLRKYRHDNNYMLYTIIKIKKCRR